MKKYNIQDREAGNTIVEGLNLIEAQKMLENFESEDRQNGNYTENFYEIVVTP